MDVKEYQEMSVKTEKYKELTAAIDSIEKSLQKLSKEPEDYRSEIVYIEMLHGVDTETEIDLLGEDNLGTNVKGISSKEVFALLRSLLINKKSELLGIRSRI